MESTPNSTTAAEDAALIRSGHQPTNPPRRSADDPFTAEQVLALGLRADRLPRHVAIIMDGNGRWAQSRGLPRIEGHRRGVSTVRTIVEQCSRLGLEQLTLYCFSSENWKRPPLELKLLMQLLEQYLIEERAEIIRQNLQFAVIGRRQGLGDGVLSEIARTCVWPSTTAAGANLSMPPAPLPTKSLPVDSNQKRSPKRSMPAICTRPACLTRIWSFGPLARCGSVITCSGRSVMPNFGSPNAAGPNLASKICTRHFKILLPETVVSVAYPARSPVSIGR
jgi:hypothetical protein